MNIGNLENLKIKDDVLIISGVGLFMLALFIIGITVVQDFFNQNIFRLRSPLLAQVPWTVERIVTPEPEVIYMQDDITIEDPLQKKICDKFGAENCAVAWAVVMAESGGRCDAVNGNTNGTVDLGLFMINSIHYDDSFTALDALDCDSNIDKAYEIWREQGWTPWVAFNNNSFKDFL